MQDDLKEGAICEQKKTETLTSICVKYQVRLTINLTIRLQKYLKNNEV